MAEALPITFGHSDRYCTSRGSLEIVALVSRPAVLRTSWPSKTPPDLEFCVAVPSVRNAH